MHAMHRTRSSARKWRGAMQRDGLVSALNFVEPKARGFLWVAYQEPGVRSGHLPRGQMAHGRWGRVGAREASRRMMHGGPAWTVLAHDLCAIAFWVVPKRRFMRAIGNMRPDLEGSSPKKKPRCSASCAASRLGRMERPDVVAGLSLEQTQRKLRNLVGLSEHRDARLHQNLVSAHGGRFLGHIDISNSRICGT